MARAKNVRAIVWFASLASLLVPWLPRASASAASAPPDQTVEVGGIVYAADGTPAAGANVWAANYHRVTSRAYESVVGEDGQFTFHLPPGQWTIRARRGSQGGEAGDSYGCTEVAADRAPPIAIIRMQERGYLRGRILALEDDSPIAGARLFLDTGLVLTTREDGYYSVGGTPLTDHEAFAVAPGRMRERILFDNSMTPEATVDIRLPRGGLVRGTVTAPDGKPAANVPVIIAASGTMLSLAGLCEFTDEHGAFTFDGVRFDRRMMLQTDSAEMENSGEYVFLSEEQPEVEIALKLMPGASKTRDASETPAVQAAGAAAAAPLRNITGNVRTQRGTKVANAIVRWGATMYEDNHSEARTSAEGDFSLEGAPDRHGYFTVIADKYAPAFIEVQGGGNQHVDVILDYSEKIAGVVQDAKGTPLEGVTVIPVIRSPDPSLCNPYWLDERKATTDRDGRFAISGLPKGGCLFDIMGPGLSDMRNQSMKIGGDQNVIVMHSTGAIRGRVVDADGKPVRDFRVRLLVPPDIAPDEPAGGYFAGYEWPGLTFTRDDGTFIVSGLTVGNVQNVVASAAGHGEAMAQRVKAAPLNNLPAADALTLTLGPAHDLTVKVTDGGGAAVAGARMAIVDGHPSLDERFSWGYDDQSWNAMHRARSDAAGSAAFRQVFSSHGTVIVQAQGFARMRLPWRKGEAELIATLEREAVVTGAATAADGRPLSDAYASLVSASTGDSMSESIDVEKGGRFEFRGLPAGHYVLKISRDRQTLRTSEFDLVAGQHYDLPPP